MGPLLSVYDRVDDQAVAVQAAVLEEVTYLKVVGTGAKHTYAKAKGATKWLAKCVGIRNSIDLTQPPGTPELVMKRAAYYRTCPAAARRFVFETLAHRLQADAADIGSLSTRIVEQAAAGYGVPDGLLVSQMAEAVAKRYIEDCVEGIREQLRKQGADEIRVTEEMLAKQISTLSPTEKLEIQKALNLQHLSGSTLRSAFISTGLPIASIAVLQAGGFGTYLALTTIMHAVFTGILGITLPFAAYTGATSALSFVTGPAGVLVSLSLGVLGYFWGQKKIERGQYAMIVWTCVMHSQSALVPSTESLPSSLKNRLLTDGTSTAYAVPEPELRDHFALEQERKDSATANESLAVAKAAASSLDSQIHKLEQRLRNSQEALASSKSKQVSETALRDALEQVVAQQQFKIAELEFELVRLGSDADSAKKQVQASKVEAIQAEQRFVNRLERRSKELKALWQIHYPKVDFDQQPLRWSAEQDFNGRLEIERALKELVEAPDPVKLSRSKMVATGEHHSRFTIPDRIECRLFYAVRNGRIEVRRMCKKKDC